MAPTVRALTDGLIRMRGLGAARRELPADLSRHLEAMSVDELLALRVEIIAGEPVNAVRLRDR